MAARLYGLSLSHPSRAARGMLELKGIEHEVVDLLPGFHAPIVRALGFPGWTVPALKLDGRRIQTSLAISRELEEIVADPPLFPSDPDARRRVEEAERWGEAVLQGVPRRAARWSAAHQQRFRLWIAGDVTGLPVPGLMAAGFLPVARTFARANGASSDAVRADLRALPGLLDRVDQLIAEGVIGGDQPNAADFQIGSSVRVLMAFEDLRGGIERRPAGALALRLFADYPEPFPASLPV